MITSKTKQQLTDLKKSVNLNHNGHNVSMCVQAFWNNALESNHLYFSQYSVQLEKASEKFDAFLEKYPHDILIYFFDEAQKKSSENYYRRTRSFEAVIDFQELNTGIHFTVDLYGRVFVDIHGASKEDVSNMLSILRETFPEKIIEDVEKKLKIDFWYYAQRPTAVTREIGVPDWSEVKANYPEDIHTKFEQLLTVKEPKNEAKLIILNGKPGCGKTYLLRTLLWEWRSWIKADFVLDPETMFGSPSYLLNLVLDSPDEFDIESPLDDEENKKWRVIILEDADNFISSTAKTENGQAVARLLNILDGLVGQGLKILFVITANEDEHKIHEAIKRPGRCLSNITFDGLSKQQAIDWLAARGIPEEYLPTTQGSQVGFRGTVETKYSLAELYDAAKNYTKESVVADASKEINSEKLQESC